jgi:hypothetical protein
MGFLECDLVYAFGLKPKMEGDFCSVGQVMHFFVGCDFRLCF